MFEATRELISSNQKPNVIVKNDDDETVENDTEKASIIRNWFSKHYTGDEPPLEPFVGEPCPLDSPITVAEVTSAAKCLKNNKARGPDDIPNELLKYANEKVYSTYANLINESFASHTHVPSFGEGYLTPLQKQKKPKGPCSSLRPLCLLNGSRKILSMITLKRMESQIENYTGQTQCAYKRGLSCGNIVWAHRMLVSVMLEKNWSFHKMAIDMSSAFDTIRRSQN